MHMFRTLPAESNSYETGPMSQIKQRLSGLILSAGIIDLQHYMQALLSRATCWGTEAFWAYK